MLHIQRGLTAVIGGGGKSTLLRILATLLRADAGEALVVDVRQPDEHELQRIPGSLLLPLDDINAESAARVLPDKNALTYVYCRSGVRSTAACEKLEALGYTNLYNLGGLTTWPYEVE